MIQICKPIQHFSNVRKINFYQNVQHCQVNSKLDFGIISVKFIVFVCTGLMKYILVFLVMKKQSSHYLKGSYYQSISTNFLLTKYQYFQKTLWHLFMDSTAGKKQQCLIKTLLTKYPHYQNHLQIYTLLNKQTSKKLHILSKPHPNLKNQIVSDMM